VEEKGEIRGDEARRILAASCSQGSHGWYLPLNSNAIDGHTTAAFIR